MGLVLFPHRSMKQSFDLIIIGGGAAAFAASIRANELKARTAMINDGLPYTIFTDPQLAGVGYTEEEQMKEMGVCACRIVAMSFTKDISKLSCCT